MGLGKYERKLISVLENNPKINTRKFIELAGLGKATFYKYTQSLQEEGYISYELIKNQREWYLMKKKKNQEWGMIDYATSKKNMDERFDEIESKVLASIKKAKTGTTSEKVIGYGDSIVLLLGNLALFKLIYYYRKKRVPDFNVRFEKRIEKLLETVVNAHIEHGFGRIAIDSVIRDSETRLEEYLGIKKDIPLNYV